MNQTLKTRRFVTLVIAALAASLLAACRAESTGSEGEGTAKGQDITQQSREAGVEWVGAATEIPGFQQRIVGRGPEAAVLVWPEDLSKPSRQAVVYLHAWSPVPPSFQAANFLPLLEGRKTAVYPVYQDHDTPPSQVQDYAMAGIAAGLEEIDADPSTLIVVGATTGGALAFDYAALARRRGLPLPRAVVAIEPGREPRGRIPAADPTRIPPAVHLMTITGPDTRIPGGRRIARAMLAEATRVPYRRRRLYRMPKRTETPASAQDAKRFDQALLEQRAAVIKDFIDKALADGRGH